MSISLQPIEKLKDGCRSVRCCSLTLLLLLQWPKLLNAPLSEVDPELLDIIEHEKNRQWKVGAPVHCS